MLDKFQATLMIAAIVQAITLAVVILGLPSGRTLANRLLVCFILLQSVFPALHYFGFFGTYPSAMLVFSLSYLAPAVLFFYVQVLIQKSPHFSWPWLWHFAPVLVLLVVLRWLLLNSVNPEAKLDVSIHYTVRLYRLSLSLLFVIYLSLCIYHIRLYQQRIRDFYADIDRITLGWLYKIAVILLLIYLILACYYSIKLFYPSSAEDSQLEGYLFRVIQASGHIALFFFMTIGGFQHQFALGIRTESTSQPDGGPELLQKPPLTSLDPQTAKALWQRANTRVQQTELYLEHDLLLPQLASALGCGARELSQAINQVSGGNFYDFINGYRVLKAEELMKSRPDLAIQDIALEAGFANRATFYKHFKKHFSVTPAQYRKKSSHT